MKSFRFSQPFLVMNSHLFVSSDLQHPFSFSTSSSSSSSSTSASSSSSAFPQFRSLSSPFGSSISPFDCLVGRRRSMAEFVAMLGEWCVLNCKHWKEGISIILDNLIGTMARDSDKPYSLAYTFRKLIQVESGSKRKIVKRTTVEIVAADNRRVYLDLVDVLVKMVIASEISGGRITFSYPEQLQFVTRGLCLLQKVEGEYECTLMEKLALLAARHFLIEYNLYPSDYFVDLLPSSALGASSRGILLDIVLAEKEHSIHDTTSSVK
jgi:hypothetical protein